MGRSTVYNENLTQNWEAVSQENKVLVKEFIQYCKSNDRSPQTIKQYEEWLKVFFCWNEKENNNKFFIDLRKRDFINYFGYLRDLDVSSSRAATLKSVLSSLSNAIELLYEDEYPMFRNQIRGLEAIRVSQVREKTILTDEDLDIILARLVEEKDFQSACYLSLLCSSGCRKAEALQMRVSFFVKNNEVLNGYFYKTPKIRAKGRGKTGKLIHKYIIKESFDPYLNLWLDERKRVGITSDSLFVALRGGVYIPAEVSTMNMFARRISAVGQIPFYAHSGRHYMCTHLKKMGLPDDIITEIFSWESSNMIKIYNDIGAEERMKDYFITDSMDDGDNEYSNDNAVDANESDLSDEEVKGD